MIKYLATTLLICCSLVVTAQISGETNPNVGTTYTYTYNSGVPQLGGVNWSATSGTVHSTTASGAIYTANISFSSAGSKTITVRNGFSNEVITTLSVTAVENASDPGAIGGTQTVCYNGDPSALTNLTSATSGSSVGYKWQSRCSSCSWSYISGATGSTYNPPNLTSTRIYRREAVVAGTNINIGFTNEVTVTVRPQLVAGGIGNAQTLCYNSNPSALSSTSNASGGNNSYTYQWQISSNNSSWSNISGATGTTYDPPTLTSSRWYRRRVISCGETKYSNTIKVTIRPNLSAGSIGNAQTLPYNSTPSTLTSTTNASGGDGTINYQWQVSSTGTSGWSNLSGATSATFTPIPLTASRWYRRRAKSCTQTKYSNNIKITINPQLQAGSIGSAQTVCYNGDPSQLSNSASASGGDNTYSYQWQSKCIVGGCNWSNISGATGATYNPPILTSTTRYRRRVSSEGVLKYSNEITVTVRTPLSAGNISGAQTICYNANPSEITSGSSASGGDNT
ncbi:MAG: hypothetical protein HRT61_22520, partial [Ekhidna sp.]|nr:hypothetical protein [Ekhidna sp.]